MVIISEAMEKLAQQGCQSLGLEEAEALAQRYTAVVRAILDLGSPPLYQLVLADAIAVEEALRSRAYHIRNEIAQGLRQYEDR